MRDVRARLVTIPISHFCEKARWALDRADVDYVEQPHLQLIHIVAARRAGGGRTVPVFVTPTGEVLAESAAIVRWADTRLAPERRLYPDGDLGDEAAALEDRFNDGLGPDGRLWMYHETLPAIRNRFTATDLAFAALAAPMLLPARYGSPLPPVEAVPDALAREVRRLRAHPAGAFAERLYDEERPGSPTQGRARAS